VQDAFACPCRPERRGAAAAAAQVFLPRPLAGEKVDYQDVEVTKGCLAFVVDPGDGSADVKMAGFGTASVSWIGATTGVWNSCSGVFKELDVTTVRGRVVEVDGRPASRYGADKGRYGGTMILGCGSRTQMAGDGTFVLEVETDPCSIWVERWNGWAEVAGDSVEIAPVDHADIHDVTLVAPPMPAWKGAAPDVQVEMDRLKCEGEVMKSQMKEVNALLAPGFEQLTVAQRAAIAQRMEEMTAERGKTCGKSAQGTQP
jgi:hypothetical protein